MDGGFERSLKGGGGLNWMGAWRSIARGKEEREGEGVGVQGIRD